MVLCKFWFYLNSQFQACNMLGNETLLDNTALNHIFQNKTDGMSQLFQVEMIFLGESNF
jgi:hypothetical protein